MLLTRLFICSSIRIFLAITLGLASSNDINPANDDDDIIICAESGAGVCTADAHPAGRRSGLPFQRPESDWSAGARVRPHGVVLQTAPLRRGIRTQNQVG